MFGAVLGAVAGLFLAWILLVSLSRFTYLGGGIGEFEGVGILKSLIFYAIFVIVGFFVGGSLFPG